jgi:4-amino-4-deoxy-L-arabinose transferase-like glycosyltransferase
MSLPQLAGTSYHEVAALRRREASSTETWLERLAPWVAAVASVWFALAAAWGLFGPIVAGHYGTMGGEGIIGENMVRWHILGPVWDYVNTRPTPAQYYCHHPWGGFWIMGVISAIFGHHDFVLPLPAVLMSAATPPLLYGIGRDAWGKVPGAAAAVGFVFLPITLGFANFHNVEATVLFACSLFFWGHARMMTTWKVRYLVASLAGAALAASADWPAYIMLATPLGISLVRMLLPRQWTPPFYFRRYATWWALSVTVSVGLLALWVVLFARSDKLADWLTSATTRGGASTTLAEALEARKQWIEISFTPLVIFIGKLAAPLALLRLLWRRRDEEAYSLSILASATASYVLFKQAADVHIFWSQYFGGYFALALAQLVASLGETARLAGTWLGSKSAAKAVRMLPLGLTVVFGLAMFPDSLRTLRYARETGGRFNEHGLAVTLESNIISVLERLKTRMPRGTAPDVIAPHMAWSWAYSWAAEATGRGIGSPPMEHASANDPHPIFVARGFGLSIEQQKALVSTFHVEIYDDEVWVVDRRAPAAPLDAFTFEEREPALWEWYFVNGVEPVRKYVRDPFSTWEWRTHLGQAASPPDALPTTLEQVRIAHNIAVAAGDSSRAAQLRNRLDSALAHDAATNFTQGISLLGLHMIKGAEPRTVLFFQSAQTPATDATFSVRAQVVARKPFSLIPPDPGVREAAIPNSLSTKLYRPGFIYSQTIVLHQRIGVEQFWGVFQSRDGSAPPVRLDGRPETPLVVMK